MWTTKHQGNSWKQKQREEALRKRICMKDVETPLMRLVHFCGTCTVVVLDSRGDHTFLGSSQTLPVWTDGKVNDLLWHPPWSIVKPSDIFAAERTLSLFTRLSEATSQRNVNTGSSKLLNKQPMCCSFGKDILENATVKQMYKWSVIDLPGMKLEGYDPKTIEHSIKD